jgi:hypothetical protein
MWAKSRARHSPSKTGVNALTAHAATQEQTILPAPVNLKYVLGDIQTNRGDLHVDSSLM